LVKSAVGRKVEFAQPIPALGLRQAEDCIEEDAPRQVVLGAVAPIR
jgi:hypothetical protein